MASVAVSPGSMATDPQLAAIVSGFQDIPEIYKPSPFWEELAATGVRQLEATGFDNFKRTVNTRYFNWRILGIIRHQILAIGADWLASPSARVFQAEFPRPTAAIADRAASFNPLAAWIYKTYVAMYADVIARQDPRGLLRTIEEPTLGNPFLVRHNGLNVSQDLCNSIHELYSILGPTGLPPRKGPVSFAEVGAGYGRVAYVVLKAVPEATYTIVDIPPALYLSQRYLTTLFPDLPAFTFRAFSKYSDVAAEFESARIRFIAPHQLELLPGKSFDYFINISSFHEMTVPQVENFFRLIDRTCRGRFYTKQWRVSRTQINGCTLRERDYPVRPTWRTVFQRRHPVQRMFFDALYEVA
jgi:putative sugar O-methyltransferase